MSAEQPLLLPPTPIATQTLSGARRYVFPRRATGPFFRARLALAIFLIILYTALPHIRINGLPAILLDIPARRFTLFGTTFWPTDTLLLAFLMMGIVVSIVAITALFGRIWCGWGCPQTVYLEFVFRPIENLFEGQGAAQRKFNESDWNRSKILRKGAKWLTFLIIAWVLANTFLAYFVGVDRIKGWITGPPLEHPLAFFVMTLLTVAIMFDFTWFREQFCTILCPYGRIQAAMIDEHTVQVSYDGNRGEPRGKVQKGDLKPGELRHGDCVDCKLCLQVCPTGVDIRNGLQLECVGCTQCIDACNEVMTRLQRPRGLIRYASPASLKGQSTAKARTRVFAYGAAIVILFSAFGFQLVTRTETKVTLLRAADEPFQLLPDNLVLNHIRLRVSNHAGVPRTYTVTLETPRDGKLTTPQPSLTVPGGEIGDMDLFVTMPASSLPSYGRQTLTFTITSPEATAETATFAFVGPMRAQS